MNVTAKYCSTLCASQHRENIGKSKIKMVENRWGAKKDLTSQKTCQNCNQIILRKDQKIQSDKNWKRIIYCSSSCAAKWRCKHPTENVLNGRVRTSLKLTGQKQIITEQRIAGRKKQAMTLKGRVVPDTQRQKMSDGQKTRWSKIKVIDRIPQKWRISQWARNLHSKLKWPIEFLEYRIEIKRIVGPFQKGERYSIFVDLAFPEVKLAIEVDGNSHKEKKQQVIDKWKEKELFCRKWTLLRFTNQQIDQNIHQVISEIKFMIFKLKKMKITLQTEF